MPDSNKHVLQLKHRIEKAAAELDLGTLEAMRFRGSSENDQGASTYYAQAGRYLRQHLAKVRAAVAQR